MISSKRIACSAGTARQPGILAAWLAVRAGKAIAKQGGALLKSGGLARALCVRRVLSVQGLGGRHGRKRLQNHRDRWHQPHILGKGGKRRGGTCRAYVARSADRGSLCARRGDQRRQGRGLPRPP